MGYSHFLDHILSVLWKIQRSNTKVMGIPSGNLTWWKMTHLPQWFTRFFQGDFPYAKFTRGYIDHFRLIYIIPAPMHIEHPWTKSSFSRGWNQICDHRLGHFILDRIVGKYTDKNKRFPMFIDHVSKSWVFKHIMKHRYFWRLNVHVKPKKGDVYGGRLLSERSLLV